jgi:hypothetical protein
MIMEGQFVRSKKKNTSVSFAQTSQQYQQHLQETSSTVTKIQNTLQYVSVKSSCKFC